MADSIINIIINTVKKNNGDKEAVAGVRKLAAGFKDLTGISLSSMTALGAVGLAVGGVSKFLKDAIGDTVEYATQVDNMSRLLGISAEDTSRLIQASDDLFISQEKLQSGLTAAARQGIDVSIEGLKALSNEYMALPEGVERSEFVLKKFGRSGAEMGKLMEIGAAGIDEATAAITKNLIITDQSMQDIINYKKSVDNLNDSWQGVKYTVGQGVIPQLDLLLRNLSTGVDDIEAHAEAVRHINDQWGMNTMWHAMGLAKDKSDEFRDAIKKLDDEFYASQDAADAAEKGLYGLKDSIVPVTAYMSELTTQLIFNQAAAGLDAEASLALAKAMGLVSPTTELAMNRIAKWRNMLDTGQISLEEYTALVKGMKDEINAVPNRTVTIRVRGEIEKSAYDAAAFAGQGSNNPYIGLTGNNRASGGPVVAGRQYIVGEVGPELFIPRESGVIVPNNRLGGNNININISGAGDPKSVANEVMRKLRLQGVA